MTEQENEMNMDSSPGDMPQKDKSMEFDEKGNKKVNPGGDKNALAKNLGDFAELHEKIKERNKQQGKSEAQAKEDADTYKANLLSSDQEKVEKAKAQDLLDQTVKTTERLLAEDYNKQNEAWIQQNPIQAQAHGMEDHHHLNNGNPTPAMKRIKAHVERHDRGHRSPLHFNGQQQQFNATNESMMNQDLEGIREGNDKAFLTATKGLNDSIRQFDNWYAKRKGDMDSQKKREAVDANANDGALIQQAQSQPSIDSASAKLMAQGWKQQFAQIKRDQASNNPKMGRDEAEMQLQQLMQNPQTYAAGRDALINKAMEFKQASVNGQVSDGTPIAVRDLLNTVAGGKGKSVVTMQDGRKITSPGLTTRNVNGAPTLMGYTEGQTEVLQKYFNEQKAAGHPNMQKITFDQFMAQLPDVGSNPEGFQQLPQIMGEDVGKAAQGVNIPMANLADGSAAIDIVPKTGQIVKDSMMNMLDTLHNDKTYGHTGTMAHLSEQQRWDNGAGDKVKTYVGDMVDMMSQQDLRGLAADYLDPPVLPEEFDALEDAEGIDKFRDTLKQAMYIGVKDDFVPKVSQDEVSRQQIDSITQTAKANIPKVIDPYHMDTESGWIGDLDYETQQRIAESDPEAKKYLDKGFWNEGGPGQGESGPMQEFEQLAGNTQWYETPEAKEAYAEADQLMKAKYDEAAKLDPYSAEGEQALMALDNEYDRLVQKLMAQKRKPDTNNPN